MDTTMTAAWKRIRIALFAVVALVAWTGDGARAGVREGREHPEAGDPGRAIRLDRVRHHLAGGPRLRGDGGRGAQAREPGDRRREAPAGAQGLADVTALAISLPPSSHFIYIPVVLVIGIVVGFMLGAKATRDEIALGQKKAAERDARMAERAARRAAASSDTAEK